MEYNLGNLLDAAADVNFIHPDGKYDAVIASAVYKTSAKGNHMAVAQFKVITGPYASKPVTIRHNFVLSPDSPRALDMLFQQLSNLGIPKAWFEQRRQLSGKELMEQLATVLPGRVGHIETKSDREFNGRKQVDVKWINPATDAGKRAAATPGAATAQNTAQTASAATETASQAAPAAESTPSTPTVQEAAQSVATSDAEVPTQETSSGGETDRGEHPAVAEAKAAAATDTGPELPF